MANAGNWHTTPIVMSEQPSSTAVTDTNTEQLCGSNSKPSTPPPAPHPSSDPTLAAAAAKGEQLGEEPSLATLPPIDALKLLSASVELLVRMTGDVPPTPPLKTATVPQMSNMQHEKANIARTHSDKSLARMRETERQKEEIRKRQLQLQQQSGQNDDGSTTREGPVDKMQAYKTAMTAQLLSRQQQLQSTASIPSADPIDGVRLRKGSVNSPPSSGSSPTQPEPYLIIGADSQPVNMQHGAITRKFYSKNEPPITIGQYLQRLHQFCPMSTAVYLATSLYIHRLAVEERAIPVTRRNAHRLVLAGLRVAMKALEDLSYPHGKVAKVGGVSEAELARLEISFCFLAGFELVVREESLRKHWETLRDGKASEVLARMEGRLGELRIGRRKKGADG